MVGELNKEERKVKQESRPLGNRSEGAILARRAMCVQRKMRLRSLQRLLFRNTTSRPRSQLRSVPSCGTSSFLQRPAAATLYAPFRRLFANVFFCLFVGRLVGRLVARLIDCAVSWLLGRWLVGWYGCSVGWSGCGCIAWLVGYWFCNLAAWLGWLVL